MAFVDAVTALGPVAYYRMGEASGTTLVDSVAGNNGTYSGGVTLGVPGLVGDADTAAQFDGSTGKAVIPYGAWMDTASFSLVLVAKPSAITWGDLAARDQVFDIEITSAGQVYGSVKTSYTDDLQGGSVAAGDTVLIGLTYDGTAGQLALNVDGVEIGTKALPGPINLPANPIYLGCYPGDVAGTFQAGVLDEFALFDKALAASDFASLQAAMAPAGPTTNGTDRTYGNYGYSYDGQATVEFDPPIAPTPAHVSRATVRRVHYSLPAPTLTNGSPT